VIRRSVKPFLWKFIKTIQKNHACTGGQENTTESLTEENRTTLIEITFGSR
jgi:hypothetical protein